MFQVKVLNSAPKCNCKYDEMIKSSVELLRSNQKVKFKYKKEIYELVDNHLRNSGVCNPECHLGKETQTAKSIINRAVLKKYIEIVKLSSIGGMHFE